MTAVMRATSRISPRPRIVRPPAGTVGRQAYVAGGSPCRCPTCGGPVHAEIEIGRGLMTFRGEMCGLSRAHGNRLRRLLAGDALTVSEVRPLDDHPLFGLLAERGSDGRFRLAPTIRRLLDS